MCGICQDGDAPVLEAHPRISQEPFGSVVLVLSLHSGNTWEHFALDSLEQSATTSGDVAYLVGKTELVDTCHRVAATDEGACAFFSCLSHSRAHSA